MTSRLQLLLFTIACTASAAKEPELPLCPTNMQFMPQNLPMHCRMPVSALKGQDSKSGPQTALPLTYQSPPSARMFQFPGLPGPAMPLPGFPGFPGPMPMPFPMQMGGPPSKLPVIVMPFYSPDPNYKAKGQLKPRPPNKPKKPKYPSNGYDEYSDTDTDTDTDTDNTSSDDTDTETDTDSDTDYDSDLDRRRNAFWKGGLRRFGKRRIHKKIHHRRHSPVQKKTNILTPMLQYVTKDGYVIFEKAISKGEAKDWLELGKDNPSLNNDVDKLVEIEDKIENNAVDNDEHHHHHHFSIDGDRKHTKKNIEDETKIKVSKKKSGKGPHRVTAQP